MWDYVLRNHAALREIYRRSAPLSASVPWPQHGGQCGNEGHLPAVESGNPGKRVIRITAEQLESGVFARDFELN